MFQLRNVICRDREKDEKADDHRTSGSQTFWARAPPAGRSAEAKNVRAAFAWLWPWRSLAPAAKALLARCWRRWRQAFVGAVGVIVHLDRLRVVKEVLFARKYNMRTQFKIAELLPKEIVCKVIEGKGKIKSAKWANLRFITPGPYLHFHFVSDMGRHTYYVRVSGAWALAGLVILVSVVGGWLSCSLSCRLSCRLLSSGNDICNYKDFFHVTDLCET